MKVDLIKKEAGVLSPMDLKKPAGKLGYTIIVLILVALAVCVFIPILWVALSGFKEATEVENFFPKHIDLGRLPEVWQKLNFLKYYMNSIAISVGCVVVCIVSCGMMGYALSKMKAVGLKLVFLLVMWSMLLPGSVSMVPLFMTFIDFPILHINMTNSFLPIWLMAGTNAFYMMLFKNFFDSIDIAYVEAAKIDGCSTMGIFTRVLLPMSIPVVSVIAILSFNAAWENFLWPYILIKNEAMMTVSIAVYSIRTSIQQNDYMIVLVYSILPPLIMFLLFHKKIMDGVQLGGVKG